MNKTKIEWADYTWNPVTGCLHGCKYCYARRVAERFRSKDEESRAAYEIVSHNKINLVSKSRKPFPLGFTPTFYPHRLNEPQEVKKPSKIFVVSMGDLFGNWVPDEWIDEVFTACFNADWHTYYFLTKNPARYERAIARYDGEERGFEIEVWNNIWFGTTITCQEDTHRIAELLKFSEGRKFVSVEPVLGPVDLTYITMPEEYQPRHAIVPAITGYHFDALKDNECYMYQSRNHLDLVIIGAQTGPGAKPPKPEWVQSIIDQCRAAGVPVFLKDNLKWPVKIQEWPE